ncbi:uncharacterized protein LOC125572240 [Nematostella vectensis]|uniref:uncharacterized protein LOC125572240 n=1 Tax=Nematostella vectensis TaxID=45351 RepID=UPI002076EC5C|nr:uncharacterized protein LOC125572240 [Nematostella vectensis]
MISNESCLRFLEQYLDGEPKELIKGCFHKGSQGYEEARKILKEKYVISNAYILKATEWPSVSYDPKSLNKFSSFLTQCRTAMSSLAYLSVLDHPHNIQSLVSKLPFSFQDRWRREASKMRERNEGIPGFAAFAQFMKIEAKVQADPVFLLEALSRHQGKQEIKSGVNAKFKKVNQPKKKVRLTGVEEEKEEKCACCKKASHDLDDCREYLKKSLRDRQTFLQENKRCYACYGLYHRSRGCLAKHTCKKCKGNHPTGLHDDDFRPSRRRSYTRCISANRLTK